MSFNFDNPFIKKNIFNGEFGLEMESLRVDEKGFLSHTKHPFDGNTHIDRDFCENQVELITNVCYSVQDLYDEITGLRSKVMTELKNLDFGSEYLWQFSNPPYVKGEEDIPIASFSGELKEKEIYRNYLAEKYGKKKMLFSGIHLNFSFPKEILEDTYKQNNHISYIEYKSRIYLELAKKLTEYSWLIVYLTASSPVFDGSFFDDNEIGKDVIPKYSSARCSEIGYWNYFIPLFDYSSLKKYIQSIQNYIKNGELKSVSELYYPIRLKPLGDNTLENLEQNGVNHIELRMLDLNPLSPVGIIKEDINFIHLLIIYLMSVKDDNFEAQKQINAINNIKSASLFDDNKILIATDREPIAIKDAVLKILESMQSFFSDYPETAEIIEYQQNKVLDKNKRYAEIVSKKYRNNYVKKGLELAKIYADEI